jgi:Flp pilus assembly protein TadG
MTMIRLRRQAIRKFLVGEEGTAGSALLEVTLIAPILVIMSIYTIDLNLLSYRQMQVQNAAQAGVDWAVANHIGNVADITAAANNAIPRSVTASATSYFVNFPVTVPNPYNGHSNPIEQCGCPSTAGGVVTGLTFTASLAPNPCPTCTVGGSTVPGGLYVTVVTQGTYDSSRFNRFGMFSGTRTLTAQATARIQ